MGVSPLTALALQGLLPQENQDQNPVASPLTVNDQGLDTFSIPPRELPSLALSRSNRFTFTDSLGPSHPDSYAYFFQRGKILSLMQSMTSPNLVEIDDIPYVLKTCQEALSLLSGEEIKQLMRGLVTLYSNHSRHLPQLQELIELIITQTKNTLPLITQYLARVQVAQSYEKANQPDQALAIYRSLVASPSLDTDLAQLTSQPNHSPLFDIFKFNVTIVMIKARIHCLDAEDYLHGRLLQTEIKRLLDWAKELPPSDELIQMVQRLGNILPPSPERGRIIVFPKTRQQTG